MMPPYMASPPPRIFRIWIGAADIQDLNRVILVKVPHKDHIVDPRAHDREDNERGCKIPDHVGILSGLLRNP